MPLQLLSRNYGSAYAGSKVLIRTTDSAAPARVYARATGGVLSASGTVTLDSSGSLSVYVDDKYTYQLTLLNQFDKAVSTEHSADPGNVSGLTTAQLAAGATGVAGLTSRGDLVVSGSIVRHLFTDSGGIAVPVSSFDGASVSGKFGLSEDILIPANTLVAGRSRIRVSVTQRKVGAANNFLQLTFGPLNSSGDATVASSQVSTAGTTPVPSVFTADLSISSDGTYTNYVHARTNVGVTTGETSVTTGINLAVDNYLNFVISGSAAGTTNALLGYTVEVFP